MIIYSKVRTILIIVSLLLFGLFGCSTVPIHISASEQSRAISLDSSHPKLPYNVAIVIPSSFSNFRLTSTLENVNLTYDFAFHVGSDISKTLPDFFTKRFNKVTVLSEQSSSDEFDFIFTPKVNNSRISTRLSTAVTLEPIYALEINFQLDAIKNSTEHSSIIIKEGAEFITEIACWTCFGADILNQDKIAEEYLSLLSRVYKKLDVHITDTMTNTAIKVGNDE